MSFTKWHRRAGIGRPCSPFSNLRRCSFIKRRSGFIAISAQCTGRMTRGPYRRCPRLMRPPRILAKLVCGSAKAEIVISVKSSHFLQIQHDPRTVSDRQDPRAFVGRPTRKAYSGVVHSYLTTPRNLKRGHTPRLGTGKPDGAVRRMVPTRLGSFAVRAPTKKKPDVLIAKDKVRSWLAKSRLRRTEEMRSSARGRRKKIGKLLAGMR